jgi:hypothetical protein
LEPPSASESSPRTCSQIFNHYREIGKDLARKKPTPLVANYNKHAQPR